jgi:hypothetical protein
MSRRGKATPCIGVFYHLNIAVIGYRPRQQAHPVAPGNAFEFNVPYRAGREFAVQSVIG